MSLSQLDMSSSLVLRKEQLCKRINEQLGCKATGALLLFGGLDFGHKAFVQESSFYYVTGLSDPGLVWLHEIESKSTIYMPEYRYDKSAWSPMKVSLNTAPDQVYVDHIKPLGAALRTNELTLLFDKEEVASLLIAIERLLRDRKTLFVLNPHGGSEYIEQRIFLNRLIQFMPDIADALVDISPLIADLRRTKESLEIDSIFHAVQLGIAAQRLAADSIADNEPESLVQASAEWVMTAAGAQPSFTSIVAGGKNATVLHYANNNGFLKNGQMVVVDIGARLEGYCSDLTRSYPVSGKFNKRQKELYSIVLEVQRHIEEVAKPGFWLSNKEYPEKSLHHIAQTVFARYGLDAYFIHNIGHFLGLDVHDVGDVSQPLRPGDVITIEPGLYIPDEEIGIRIEDDYWMAGRGLVCLSDDLEKDIEAIEDLMRKKNG